MQLQDALFNWLQMKVVSQARPNDTAAEETERFFMEILTEDHLLSNLQVDSDETMYKIRYEVGGKSKLQMFEKEAVDRLLADIQAEPRYNQQ